MVVSCFFSSLRESYTFMFMTLSYTYIYILHYSFDNFDGLIFACFCELQYFCFWDCLSVCIFYSWNLLLAFCAESFSIYIDYYSLFVVQPSFFYMQMNEQLRTCCNYFSNRSVIVSAGRSTLEKWLKNVQTNNTDTYHLIKMLKHDILWLKVFYIIPKL